MSCLNNRRGQGLVEYILVVVVMAILAIGVIQHLGKSVSTAFDKSATDLDKAFKGM